MTRGEIARKYTRLRLEDKITEKQYDWLLSQATDDVAYNLKGSGTGTTSEIKDSPSPQTTSSGVSYATNGMAEVDLLDSITMLGGQLTQGERLLMLLEDNQWHDTKEILLKVYGNEQLGLSRVGARIYDLKQKGYDIISRHKKGTIWEYKLQ